MSTKETASLLAASVERKGRILPNLRNWQTRIRHRRLICTSMDSVSSIKTPRFQTDWENGMLWPDMDTGIRLKVTWLILGLVPMAMSSVLSWFIFNILSHIHSATSSIQSFKLWTRTVKSEGVLELWSWESSAKKWYKRPDWQMTVRRDCVYKVNKRCPRTEPCGTPHFKADGVDAWPTKTDWVWKLR